MARSKKTKGQRVWISGHVIDYLAAKGYDVEHLQVAIEHELVSLAIQGSMGSGKPAGTIKPFTQPLENSIPDTREVEPLGSAEPISKDDSGDSYLEEFSADDVEI